jgi:hypothetical protein
MIDGIDLATAPKADQLAAALALVRGVNRKFVAMDVAKQHDRTDDPQGDELPEGHAAASEVVR